MSGPDCDHLDRETLGRLLHWPRMWIFQRWCWPTAGAIACRCNAPIPTSVHRDYGRVFMVGRKRGERDFSFLRDLGGKLQGAGAFSVEQLQFP